MMRTEMKKRSLKPEEVISTIKTEYPDLSKYDLRVTKQFASTNGRKYNVFLIEVPDSPWKKFVAKSYWYEGHDLSDEVRMIEILQKNKVDIPVLLFPYRNECTFLIMSYIEGICAREIVEDKSKIGQVYSSMGETLKKIYSVSVPGFGKFWRDKKVDWEDFIEEKFNERLTPSIEMKLIRGIKNIYKEGRDAISEDSKKGPVLIHRDTYTDNFIIEKETGRAVLIDFAMAIGGRPFYDLAKFYIIDLSRDPEGQEPFLEGLGIEARGNKELQMLRAYTVIELMGMVNFFNSIKDEKMKNHAGSLLSEVVLEKGTFSEVLDAFRK